MRVESPTAETDESPSAGEQPSSASDSNRGPSFLTFTTDVFTHDRHVLVSAGERFSAETLERAVAGRRSNDSTLLPLFRTGVLDDLKGFLSRPTYHHLFGKVRRQFELFSLIRDVPTPQLLASEFAFLRRTCAWAYEQAIVSASMAVLLLRHQFRDDAFLRQAWLAMAARDLGISRIRSIILNHERTLSPGQFSEYLQHEAISALLCARAMGPGLAVYMAARHHRASPSDQWAPGLEGIDESLIEKLKAALNVADSFAGMLSPRTFRSTTYSTRGAVDTLLSGLSEGRYEENIVHLLVAYCRREFSPEGIRISQRRDGFVPKVNYYGVSI